MKKQIKLFLLFSSVFAMVYWSSCTPDDVVEPPEPTLCDILYPLDITIDEPQPTFVWCSINEALVYHVQIGEDNTFAETRFDTIVNGNSLFPKYLEPIPNTTYSVLKEFGWGGVYYWRVAPIINGVQGDWSAIYEFQTWDARDKVVGTYMTQKYLYKANRLQNNYLDTAYGTFEIKIEKIENSRNILFTEIGGHNLRRELEGSSINQNSWNIVENPPYGSLATFNMPNDSFEIIIMTSPVDPNAHGYYFGGFQ
jgi:hypothetical protein